MLIYFRLVIHTKSMSAMNHYKKQDNPKNFDANTKQSEHIKNFKKHSEFHVIVNISHEVKMLSTSSAWITDATGKHLSHR